MKKEFVRICVVFFLTFICSCGGGSGGIVPEPEGSTGTDGGGATDDGVGRAEPPANLRTYLRHARRKSALPRERIKFFCCA